MSTPIHQEVREWENELREYIDKTLKPRDKNSMGNLDREIIVDFVRNLLHSQHERLVGETRKLSKKKLHTPDSITMECWNCGEKNVNYGDYCELGPKSQGFNEALDAVIRLLTPSEGDSPLS